jgi:hypothetical protein
MYLREIAAAKAGDKGNTSNVSVIPYDESDYEFLCEVLTVERVREHFGDLVKGSIRRYEMPGIRALNFVMEEALSGGITRSLCIDPHGKARGSLRRRAPSQADPACHCRMFRRMSYKDSPISERQSSQSRACSIERWPISPRFWLAGSNSPGASVRDQALLAACEN